MRILSVCTCLIGFFCCLSGVYAQTPTDIDPHEITIARDSFGVPHIFGPTDAHVAYGLAWAHCEDNFHDLQRKLIFARARMGEIDGKAGAASDFFIHYIRARDQVDSTIHRLDAATRAILRGYVLGTNAYAEMYPREHLLNDLFPITEQDVLTGYVGVLAGMTGLPLALKSIYAGTPEDYAHPPRFGSNAFAFNARRTTYGQTTVVINPHLPLQGENAFWEAHVCSDEGWNVCGALFPGMVTPAMGATPHHAYAMTFNWPDYVDIYHLRINPRNQNQYWYEGQWRDMDIREVKIKVKVAGIKITVKKEVIYTVYGPAMRTKKGVFATAFAQNYPVMAVQEWYRLGRAESLQEFQAAIDIQAVPLFNIFYGDADDNIFYQFNALLPQRQPGFPWQGILPGDTAATRWGAYTPRTQLPFYENPNCGILYNTNNTPFHATPCPADNLSANNYPVEHDYANNRANNRDWRVREILMAPDAPPILSTEQILALKYDAAYPDSGAMRSISACVVDSLNPADYTGRLAEAVRLVKTWDYTGNPENRVTALMFIAFSRAFAEYNADYGSVEVGLCIPKALFIKHLKKAADQLYAKYGRLDVPWADIHRIRRGDHTIGVGGLPEALQAMYATEVRPCELEVHTGESYIGVARYTAEGLQSYETVTAFGQSMNPASAHYVDQMPLFAGKRRKAMSLDRETILRNATRTYSPVMEVMCGH